MRPDIARFLEVAAAHVMFTLGPALGAGYEQSNALVLGAMLMNVREEFDRAAARRVEENDALRGLFGRASAVVADEALGERLAAAAASGESSLLVADLERSNDALRSLLIELHAHVEELDTPEARVLDEAIWQELVASTDRRAFTLGVL